MVLSTEAVDGKISCMFRYFNPDITCKGKVIAAEYTYVHMKITNSQPAQIGSFVGSIKQEGSVYVHRPTRLGGSHATR